VRGHIGFFGRYGDGTRGQQFVGRCADPSLEGDACGTLLLQDVCRLVFRDAFCASQCQHVLAVPCSRRQACTRCLQLFMRMVLHEPRELQALAGVEGVHVRERGLAAGVGGSGLHLHRLPADRGIGGGLPRGALVGGQPFLADADALHRHRVAGRVKAGRPRCGEVVDADAQRGVGKLGCGLRCLRGTQCAGTGGAGGFGAPDCKLQRSVEGQGGRRRKVRQQRGGQQGRA